MENNGKLFKLMGPQFPLLHNEGPTIFSRMVGRDTTERWHCEPGSGAQQALHKQDYQRLSDILRAASTSEPKQNLGFSSQHLLDAPKASCQSLKIHSHLKCGEGI